MNTVLSQWHLSLFDPDRIPYALIAILITMIIGAITGPVAGNANPALWFAVDKLLGGLGDRLDRLHRPRGDLVFRGFLITAVALFLALILAKIIENLIFGVNFYGLAEPLALSLLLTAGAVWFALLRLYYALEKDQVGQGAYYAISHSTRRNLTAGDDFGITRGGMGFAVRSFDKGLVSPVFWYLVGGLPLALLYSTLAALAWRFGKDGFSKGLGAVALTLERLMGFIPSLFAGFLVSLASIFTPTAGIYRSLKTWAGAKNRAPYEQGGYPLSALAWALDISLGGASQDLTGSAIKGVWTGPEGATAKLNHKHLRRALYMSVIAHILFMACLCGAYLCARL